MAPVSRHAALVVLGLALVSTPLWAPVLDVTGTDYAYERTAITAENGTLSLPERALRLSGLDGFDCYAQEPSRRCAFEATLLNGSTALADHPDQRSAPNHPGEYLGPSDRYVAFASDGRVFRRTTGWNESAGAFVLGLERVDAAAALAEQARAVERTDGAVRRAVETGSARAERELDEPVLVDAGDRYVVVYDVGRRQFLSAKPLTERLLEAVAALAGVLVLRRAWQESVRVEN